MAKRKKSKDPFAQREAEKYADPIPSREYILTFLEQAPEPLEFDDLCQALELTSDAQQDALQRRLLAMRRDGQLVGNRRGVFGVPNRMELIKGRVQGNKDGYGYFVPSEGGGDLLLSPREMQKVFDGDIVLARVSGQDRRGRKEGMIAEVLTRRSAQIVGRFYAEQGFGILIPDNRRIHHEIIIPEQATLGAKDGEFVVGEITTWPTERLKPVASIVEILGDSRTPGLEIDIAVRSHGIPHVWPAEVDKQIIQLAAAPGEKDYRYRHDLRDLPFVTIDGEDAKDFDDAVYAEPVPAGGWTLLVAIADVSHYVKVGSALDEEAANRGTSVYFPGHVIPMLPEKLSNDLCSLKPEVDRLVMVCAMTISSRGELSDYRFFEGVIHSKARMTYTEVAAIIESPTSQTQEKLQQRLRKRHESLVEYLDTLHDLYRQLHEARFRNGALDFDTTETRIVFSESRKIKEIVPVVRNTAHRLIEECMLSANVATARLLLSSGLPALYRVHDGPSEEKLQNLREYLGELGLALGGGDKPKPRDFQQLLARIAERPDAHLLQTVVIRSLMQAVYQPQNIGHFGLGYDAYAHFTSPIRRYPDLLVHRAIRYLIRAGKGGKHVLRVKAAESIPRDEIYPYSAGQMQGLGETCSFTERRADAASYDVVDWLKCEYIQGHIGDELPGTVSSVTGFGLFVELDDIYIEGLVHITALDNDYYHFDPIRHQLKGERRGKIYRLGDSVRVKVAAVSLDERKIDLVMAGTEGSAPRGRTERDAPAGRKTRGRSTPAGKPGKPGKPGKSGKPAAGKGAGNGSRAEAAMSGKAGGKSKKPRGKRGSGKAR